MPDVVEREPKVEAEQCHRLMGLPKSQEPGEALARSRAAEAEDLRCCFVYSTAPAGKEVFLYK